QRGKEMRRVADFLGLDYNLFGDYENLHTNVSIGGKKVHRSLDKYLGMMKAAGKIFPRSFRRFIFNKILLQKKFMEKPALKPETKKRILDYLESDIRGLEK